MKIFSFLVSCALIVSGSANAATPAYLEQHTSTPEDLRAIANVIDDFQTAIKTKNPKLLSTLVLNSKILFSSPWPAEDIQKMRNETDVTFDGLDAGGYSNFSKLLKTEKSAIEEKFYNVNTTQDDNVAWVMFDFEFLKDGVVLNHGVEAWQLMKSLDGRWKIFSVVWSSLGKPPK